MKIVRNIETKEVAVLFSDDTPHRHNDRGFFSKDRRLNGPWPTGEWEIVDVDAGPSETFVNLAYTYDNGTWTKAKVNEVAAAVDDLNRRARRRARKELMRWADKFLDEISGEYPALEKLTWPMQASAAKHHIAQTISPDEAAFLSGLAEQRGLSINAMANRIVTRATKFESAIQRASAWRDRVQKQIGNAQHDEIDGIMKTAKQQAIAFAKQLGLKQ